MRNFEERMNEIRRRSEEMLQKRRRRKKLLFSAVPAVLCAVVCFGAVWSHAEFDNKNGQAVPEMYNEMVSGSLKDPAAGALEADGNAPGGADNGSGVKFGDHTHQTSLRGQVEEAPFEGDYGNAVVTVDMGDQRYTFSAGHAETLTQILHNLDYDPQKTCRCMEKYRIDTQFGSYSVNPERGFARCKSGQADLTVEQIKAIEQAVLWAETTHAAD